jgi:hypothetical protein
MKKRTLKPADVMLWLIMTAATVFVVTGFGSGQAGRFVTVISPEGSKTVGLGDDQTFTVEGRDGAVTIEIHDGAAAIVESPCPRKLCVRQGYINRVGQSVICLPEGVKIVISDGTDTYDAVIQ